jgi:Zn-dependent membrane protease YugP
VVAFGSQIWLPLVFVGTFIGTPLFIQLAAILFMTVLAFHVVALPVEINAFTRAYGLLTRYGIPSGTGSRRHKARASRCLHLHRSGLDRVPNPYVFAFDEPERTRRRVSGA